MVRRMMLWMVYRGMTIFGEVLGLIGKGRAQLFLPWKQMGDVPLSLPRDHRMDLDGMELPVRAISQPGSP